jgi:hypothetical protein
MNGVSPFAILASALGALFLLGAGLAVRTFLFTRSSSRVRATIVGREDASVHNPETGSQSSASTRYVVEFTQAGRKRRVRLAEGVGGAIADKLVASDGTVPVLFDPRRPAIVRIDSPWTLYFIPAFLCTPAILFAALVAYVWSQA